MATATIEDGSWTLRATFQRDGVWSAWVSREAILYPRFTCARFVLGDEQTILISAEQLRAALRDWLADAGGHSTRLMKIDPERSTVDGFSVKIERVAMGTSKQRWSIWKRLLVYPLILVVAVEALCVWVVIDETVSPPRIINGRADDAPRNAGLILGMLVAVLYIAYGALVAIARVVVIAVTNGSDSDKCSCLGPTKQIHRTRR